MLALSAWFLPAAAASPCTPVDAGRTHPRAPAVLIVQTPGISAEGYLVWVHALESRGLDALVLPCAQETGAIQSALVALSGRPTALLGHSFGGTLAAMSVADGARPDALGLIGAPLRSTPTHLDWWLADRPLPEDMLDPRSVATVDWNGSPVLPLLIGQPLPPLEPVSSRWLTQLRDWAQGTLEVDLRQSLVPIMALASGMDNVAPPERVRPQLPANSFMRLGYLSFTGPDPEHADLLLEDEAIHQLTGWLREQLR